MKRLADGTQDIALQTSPSGRPAATMPPMCGRYTQAMSWHEMVRLYRITETARAPNLNPRYNAAPSQQVPIVRATAAGGRALIMVRWGLVPPWARDGTIGSRLINARAETVAEKPSFRGAFKARRCLVPADGFYEWTTAGGVRQPHRIVRRDRQGFAFAGLWERWDRDPGGAPLETCAIVTTVASDDLRAIHGRMPVILDPADYDAWLDVAATAPVDAARLLRPFPDGLLEAYPVDRRVNDARNDDAECAAPAP